MYKIYCCVISILFFGVCFSGYDADASDAVKYMSNRVKVVRPEKIAKISEPSVPDSVITPEDVTKIAAAQDVQKPEIGKPVDMSETVSTEEDSSVSMSEEKSEAEIREEVAALIGKKQVFYSRKGRIDPFEPFLRKPEPDIAEGEVAELKRRIPRTPLEKIDLSQLRLTAVLRTPTKTKALVQEASGKGYVVNEGTFIGNKGGQVSKILKDKMMVEEKYLDVFGKISVREREMKLQQ